MVGGPCVTPEPCGPEGTGQETGQAAALPRAWQSRSLRSPSPHEYGGAFTQPRAVGFVSLPHSLARQSGVTRIIIIPSVLTSDLNTSREKRKKKVGLIGGNLFFESRVFFWGGGISK